MIIQRQYFAAGRIYVLATFKTGARAMHHAVCLLIPPRALLVWSERIRYLFFVVWRILSGLMMVSQ